MEKMQDLMRGRLRLNQQCDEIQALVLKHGRWHIRRRKSDSSRIWRYLYKEIDECTVKKNFHTNGPFFQINFRHLSNKYICQVHTIKSFGTTIHAIPLQSECDLKAIQANLANVLSHYNLKLVDKSEPNRSVKTFEIVFEHAKT